jgi:hypothetical protein
MGAALRAQTARFAANVLPIVREVQGARYTSATPTSARLAAGWRPLQQVGHLGNVDGDAPGFVARHQMRR